jgi:hypothetical protein
MSEKIIGMLKHLRARGTSKLPISAFNPFYASFEIRNVNKGLTYCGEVVVPLGFSDKLLITYSAFINSSHFGL